MENSVVFSSTSGIGRLPENVWLGESRSTDVGLVGGKAANLGRLAGLHLVPPGFCLTTAAHAIAETRTAAEQISHQIREAYQTLARALSIPAPSVAVRSSAVDEDGANTSFAGQHETFLNIVGAEAVGDAVTRCWASLRSERALEYRQQMGLTTDGLRLAVLVQQMILADVSAIIFSANPVTGNRDEIVINASWGIGESVVGGTVTPDTYTVRKGTLSVIGRERGDKRRMTVVTADGTREVDTPRLLRERFALSDTQIGSMAVLARDLEANFGWPVDVECAMLHDRLYLLQCRRITTLGLS